MSNYTITLQEGIDWTNAPVSMHTKQKGENSDLIPIEINERGDKAREPWPLLADGTAVHYNDINSQDFEAGVLQAGGNDLEMITKTNFSAFFSKHKLRMAKFDA